MNIFADVLENIEEWERVNRRDWMVPIHHDKRNNQLPNWHSQQWKFFFWITGSLCPLIGARFRDLFRGKCLYELFPPNDNTWFTTQNLSVKILFTKNKNYIIDHLFYYSDLATCDFCHAQKLWHYWKERYLRPWRNSNQKWFSKSTTLEWCRNIIRENSECVSIL